MGIFNSLKQISPLKLRGGIKGGDISKILLKISGMHCTSCSLNIDLDLEDAPGIISAKTNYAKSVSEITYDTKKIDLKKIISVIQNTGYTAKLLN